jgi:hypothetical protein
VRRRRACAARVAHLLAGAHDGKAKEGHSGQERLLGHPRRLVAQHGGAAGDAEREQVRLALSHLRQHGGEQRAQLGRAVRGESGERVQHSRVEQAGWLLLHRQACKAGQQRNALLQTTRTSCLCHQRQGGGRGHGCERRSARSDLWNAAQSGKGELTGGEKLMRLLDCAALEAIFCFFL